MNVIAIPFLEESPALVAKNLEIAISHPAIDTVWGIAGDATPWVDGPALAPSIEIVPQARIGNRRPGKGDAMNTAIDLAFQTGVDRLYFYDADITNFDHSWIDGARAGADLGYDTVRHSFPRAATDAMVTWMITKPLLAMKFPGTVLTRIAQPLGGELLLTKPTITSMATSRLVRDRSDWGIDTALTFNGVASGHSLYEHHVADGKRHSLYGSLAELKTMVTECFDVAARLPAVEIPDVDHFAEPTTDVPSDLRSQSGYSVAATLPLLVAPWGVGEREQAASIMPDEVFESCQRMVDTGDYEFLDETVWQTILTQLSAARLEAGPAPDDLLFRLWVGRVLNYTTNHAASGYESALDYLHDTVDQYEKAAILSQRDQR